MVKLYIFLIFIGYNSCKIYTFTDATIPDNIKTVRVGYIENKATYINPQLGVKLNEKILQTIISKTKLVGVKNDQANYIIKGTILEYNPSQTIAANSTAATVNRLSVYIKFELTNTVDNTVKEFDLRRNWDFDAGLTLQQVEPKLLDEIIKSFSDDLFNQIFSNW